MLWSSGCWMGSFLLVAVSVLTGCGDSKEPAKLALETEFPLEFVGNESCASCHQDEVEHWQGSHHDLAMQIASPATVLGDFDNATFLYGGITSRFYRRNDGFFVETDGPDGRLQEFEVSYTFGVDPLQQYLIELPGGRFQALSICWDTRPVAQGGQRWFHLYPDEVIDSEDPLHWTGSYQNWNYMCAECHSTNLVKGYQAAQDRYETRWSEIDVSCEACHGPASNHLEWAKALATGSTRESTSGFGLVVDLADRDGGVWLPEVESGISRRSKPRESDAELQTCSRCHSRRSVIREEYHPGRPLVDTHRPSLLEPFLYHPDGQILEEVYVYGSFLQSKMHAAGVTCSDCHDPHSLEVKAGGGDAVCSTCHAPQKFSTPDHHFHPLESPGANCLNCHMPESTYMVVDDRRDHSFRIPRPDLSDKLGVPNSCTSCHLEESANWASEQISKHSSPATELHFGEVLFAGRNGSLGATTALSRLAGDPSVPSIARASAVSLLVSDLNRESLGAIEAALYDDDPLVRATAALSLGGGDPQMRAEVLLPLLSDPIRLVRIQAARSLVGAPKEQMTPEQLAALSRGLAEYEDSQFANEDRPDARANLGLLYAEMGEYAEAEIAYQTALELDPGFLPAYANLSDLYRIQERENEAEEVLDRGLDLFPESADLIHALGLSRVRQNRLPEALALLEQSTTLNPEDRRMAYVLGVALNSGGQPARAVSVLQEAHGSFPEDPQILWALATIYRDLEQWDEALVAAEKLMKLLPGETGPIGLLESLSLQSRGTRN